jgi:hypothetical protein
MHADLRDKTDSQKATKGTKVKTVTVSFLRSLHCNNNISFILASTPATTEVLKQELAESAEDELIAVCRDTEPEVRIHLCDLCALLFKNFGLFGCGSAALCSFAVIYSAA